MPHTEHTKASSGSSGSPFVHSPLVHSARLSHRAPCKVLLKQEFVQPSGSYKLRGLSHHIRTHLERIKSTPAFEDKQIVVVAASGGNAGNAVSYAASFYGLDAIIVVPSVTNENMRSKIEDNGASVIVGGSNIGEADEYLRQVVIPQLADDVAPVYCHPYDSPAVWEGHSTIVDEVVSDLKAAGQLHCLKGIVCSIGGGGLYNGLVGGLERHGLSEVPVLTLETDSCPTFQVAIDAREPVVLESFKSIATSLACPYITKKSLENYNTHKTKNVLVSDAEAAGVCLEFARDFNVIVEPACGVALASIYDGVLEEHREFFGGFAKDDIVVVVVCGGSATTLEDLASYKKAYGL